MKPIDVWAAIVALMAVPTGCAVAPASPAQTGQPAVQAKVHRIGYLASGTRNPWHDSFPQGLSDLGYVDGQNIVIDWRFAEGQPDKLAAFASELVAAGTEVIVTGDTPAMIAAKKVTSTAPLVMGISADPVANGFAQSLSRPGGNITGLSSFSVETAGKRLELLKEMVPRAERVGVLWVPGNPVRDLEWAEIERAAQTLRVEVKPFKVTNADEIQQALDAAGDEGLDALLVAGEPLFNTNRALLAEGAARAGLPAVHERDELVTAGALASYGVSLPDLLRRSAAYVDKILKGANPGELPIEQPTLFRLVINLRAARDLGLTIDPSVLNRADQLID